MFDKIKAILGSVRFWQIIIATLAFNLGQEGIITPWLADTISTALGISTTVGTLDKLRKPE